MKTQEEKAEHAEYMRNFYRTNPEARAKAKARRQERFAADPEAKKRNNAYGRKSRTGVSKEQFDEAWRAQDGKCAICADELRAGNAGHAADHCHQTKKFRGILCHACNTGLGKFKDSPELLMKAKAYLEH